MRSPEPGSWDEATGISRCSRWCGGFAAFDPTGYFGLLTRTAVKRLQLAHGIPGTSYVGPRTLAYFNGRYNQLQ